MDKAKLEAYRDSFLDLAIEWERKAACWAPHYGVPGALMKRDEYLVRAIEFDERARPRATHVLSLK